MSVELVVSNPNVIPAPRITRAGTARARLEAQYRRRTSYVKATRFTSGSYVHLGIWRFNDGWRLSFTLHVGPPPFESADVNLYPTQLAAFDHGVACLRRLVRAAALKFPDNAALMNGWLNALEVPK